MDEYYDSLMNIILVSEKIRPACLLQYFDWNKYIKSLIKIVENNFPKLKVSEDYQEFQGFIISYNDYNKQIIDLNKMGKILGYPCYGDFDPLNAKNRITYNISIIVYLENGKKMDIMVNICNDKTKINEFEILASKILPALKKYETSLLKKMGKIKKVECEVKTIVPNKIVMEKMIKKEELTKDDLLKIESIIKDLFNDDKISVFKIIDLSNNVHIGIVLSLLNEDENRLLSPFYPLHEYPEQQKEYNIIFEKWKKRYIYILKMTK